MPAPLGPRSYIEVDVGEFHSSNASIYEIDDGRQIGMGKRRGRHETVSTRRANIHSHSAVSRPLAKGRHPASPASAWVPASLLVAIAGRWNTRNKSGRNVASRSRRRAHLNRRCGSPPSSPPGNARPCHSRSGRESGPLRTSRDCGWFSKHAKSPLYGLVYRVRRTADQLDLLVDVLAHGFLLKDSGLIPGSPDLLVGAARDGGRSPPGTIMPPFVANRQRSRKIGVPRWAAGRHRDQNAL